MKVIYILYKDNQLIMTHGDLERARQWQKATSNSVLYKAVLEEI